MITPLQFAIHFWSFRFGKPVLNHSPTKPWFFVGDKQHIFGTFWHRGVFHFGGWDFVIVSDASGASAPIPFLTGGGQRVFHWFGGCNHQVIWWSFTVWDHTVTSDLRMFSVCWLWLIAGWGFAVLNIVACFRPYIWCQFQWQICLGLEQPN